jgi:hypothetical protein
MQHVQRAVSTTTQVLTELRVLTHAPECYCNSDATVWVPMCAGSEASVLYQVVAAFGAHAFSHWMQDCVCAQTGNTKHVTA